MHGVPASLENEFDDRNTTHVSLFTYNSWFICVAIFLDILVTTPNRLVHMLQQDPPAVQLDNVEWLILDEADKLFEEGKDGFRDQVFSRIQNDLNPNTHNPNNWSNTIIFLGYNGRIGRVFTYFKQERQCLCDFRVFQEVWLSSFSGSTTFEFFRKYPLSVLAKLFNPAYSRMAIKKGCNLVISKRVDSSLPPLWRRVK